MSEKDVLLQIETVIHKCGSAKEAAQFFGVSPQYLHDIRKRRREISVRILDKLGIEKITLYRWKDQVTP